MKQKTLITILTLLPLFGLAQAKPDTTKKYTLSEPDILQISQLLSFGDNAAGNSTAVSTNDWKAYHSAVLRVDSVLRVQYLRFHPEKAQPVITKP